MFKIMMKVVSTTGEVLTYDTRTDAMMNTLEDAQAVAKDANRVLEEEGLAKRGTFIVTTLDGTPITPDMGNSHHLN